MKKLRFFLSNLMSSSLPSPFPPLTHTLTHTHTHTQMNRFEQLCINYANEKLQQRFTQDVFKAVQAEYQAEGIKWELINYEDNADVLELLEGRLGILDLLNEEVP
jgi:myosin heavy subunit